MLIEPVVLRTAQQIYYDFVQVHPIRSQYVTGIAIDRETCRGHIIFRQQPVLLPGEYFISVDQLVVSGS